MSVAQHKWISETDDALGIPRILFDLADGRLDAAEADAVVDWLKATAEAQPPPWLVTQAMRIARQPTEQRPTRTAVLRHLVASLVYDTRLQLRLAGARGVGAEQPRLMYHAGGVEIDLEVGDSSIAGRLRMLGQVTAGEPDLAGAWVVAEDPTGRVEAEVDDLGQFILDPLLAGRHRLQIGLAYELIEIPEFEL